MIEKKTNVKKFSTRKDAIRALEFACDVVFNGSTIDELTDLKNELVIDEGSDVPKQVIDYLNEITSSNFRQTGHIERICRVMPRVTLDQFKSIILFKWEKWGADELMSQYMTPATLFGSTNKFKNYLDEATNHWIKKAKDQAMKFESDHKRNTLR